VYAIIERVGYRNRAKRIDYACEYFPTEQAYVEGATPLVLTNVPKFFAQAATPEQVNGLPVFQFLEQLLTAELTKALPAGTKIVNVA